MVVSFTLLFCSRLLSDFVFVVRVRLTSVHFENVGHSVIREYAFFRLPLWVGGGAHVHVCVRACVYNKRNPSKTGAEACQICCHDLSDFFLVDVFHWKE